MRSPRQLPDAPGGSARNLHFVLAVVIVGCAAIVALLAVQILDKPVAGADDATPDDSVSQAEDEDFEPVAPAARSDRARIAGSLRAAEQMTTYFLNLSFENLESSFAELRSRSTTGYREKFDRSVSGIRKATMASKSVSVTDVVWTAYVDGDATTATVLLAATGTIDTAAAKEPARRTYRVLVKLRSESGDWLTDDLQFVA